MATKKDAGLQKAKESHGGRGKGKPFKQGDKRAGRPKGALNRVTLEVKAAAAALVENGAYRQALQERLLAGKCHAAVETMLWHYAYGKPKEFVELTGPGGKALGGPQVMLYMPDNGRAIAAPDPAAPRSPSPDPVAAPGAEEPKT